MTPIRREKYTIKFIEADSYGVHGYQGPYRRVFSVKGDANGVDVSEGWIGDFHKTQNGGGGGDGQ
jgi:hypothetical protein